MRAACVEGLVMPYWLKDAEIRGAACAAVRHSLTTSAEAQDDIDGDMARSCCSVMVTAAVAPDIRAAKEPAPMRLRIVDFIVAILI